MRTWHNFLTHFALSFYSPLTTCNTLFWQFTTKWSQIFLKQQWKSTCTHSWTKQSTFLKICAFWRCHRSELCLHALNPQVWGPVRSSHFPPSRKNLKENWKAHCRWTAIELPIVQTAYSWDRLPQPTHLPVFQKEAHSDYTASGADNDLHMCLSGWVSYRGRGKWEPEVRARRRNALLPTGKS